MALTKSDFKKLKQLFKSDLKENSEELKQLFKSDLKENSDKLQNLYKIDFEILNNKIEKLDQKLDLNLNTNTKEHLVLESKINKLFTTENEDTQALFSDIIKIRRKINKLQTKPSKS